MIENMVAAAIFFCIGALVALVHDAMKGSGEHGEAFNREKQHRE